MSSDKSEKWAKNVYGEAKGWRTFIQPQVSTKVARSSVLYVDIETGLRCCPNNGNCSEGSSNSNKANIHQTLPLNTLYPVSYTLPLNTLYHVPYTLPLNTLYPVPYAQRPMLYP